MYKHIQITFYTPRNEGEDEVGSDPIYTHTHKKKLNEVIKTFFLTFNKNGI